MVSGWAFSRWPNLSDDRPGCGLFPCRYLILVGLYAQAAGFVKQEIFLFCKRQASMLYYAGKEKIYAELVRRIENRESEEDGVD